MLKGNIELYFRKYTLLVSISLGIVLYFIYRHMPFLEPYKKGIRALFEGALPCLIFIMLYIAFCKIELKHMRLRLWHVINLFFQILIPFALAFFLCFAQSHNKLYILSLIVMIVTPTAAASAVITGKLGGSESSLTTYTLLSNTFAALCIPFLFAISGSTLDVPISDQIVLIAKKVMPVILLPLALSLITRYYLKKLHYILTHNLSDLPFYLWALTLVIVCAKVVATLVNTNLSIILVSSLGFVALITCLVQFSFGKIVGNFFIQRISSGQALGQKNIVLAIWFATTYFDESVLIACGFYMIWQNIINALQLFFKDSLDKRRHDQGLPLYKEV